MKTGTLSYSRIKLYKQCQLKFKLKYVENLPDQSGPAAERGKTIHSAIETMLTKGAGAMPAGVVSSKWTGRLREYAGKVTPEVQFGFTDAGCPTGFNATNAFFRGAYDAIGNNHKASTMPLFEFKTGKARPEHAEQISCYGRSLFISHPNLQQVTGKLVYLDLPDNPCITDYNFDRGPEKDVVPRFMEPIWRAAEMIENDDVASACQSPLCKYCNYRKDNGGPCKF